jgi:hypothetical protein
MHPRWIVGTVALALITLATQALAERAPEARSKATHVVVGKVEGVYLRTDEDTHYYLVEIAVEKVEKGDRIKPGETFYVSCYQWNRDWYKGKTLSEKRQKELVMRGAAYDGVPREGERVKMYAIGQGGKYRGIYPNWYDVVKR